PLATSLAAYLDARASSVGLEAAKSALAANLETLGRTLGGDALLHHAELGRAWWLSRAHPAERGGKVATGVCEEGSFTDAGMSYAYRLPREYDPASAYPLILAIPAEDEKPADHLRADWVEREVQERVILLCPEMPRNPEDWDKVMVKGRPGGLCHVLTALRVASE